MVLLIIPLRGSSTHHYLGMLYFLWYFYELGFFRSSKMRAFFKKCSAGRAFCTLITIMRGHNRIQLKSLMDSPSVASEIQRDLELQTGMPRCQCREFLLTSLSKVSLALCIMLWYWTSLFSEHLCGCNEAGAAVARPGKVVGSVLHYNNCGAATGVEALEQQQRRMVRNPAGASQYPKRTQPCKSSRGDEDCATAEGPNRMKPNTQYIPQKVGAAQDTAMSLWY